MAEIILKSNTPAKTADILKDALAIEASRLKYSLNLAKKRLKRFETICRLLVTKNLMSGPEERGRA